MKRRRGCNHIMPGVPLSNREVQVVSLLAEGLSYKEVGEQLFLALPTIRTHVNNINYKLSARNTTNAVVLWDRAQRLESEK